jgi:hypothetical protein
MTSKKTKDNPTSTINVTHATTARNTGTATDITPENNLTLNV